MAELAVLGTALAAEAATAAAAGGAAAAAAAPVAAGGFGTALTAAATAASLTGSGLAAAGAAKQGQHSKALGAFNAAELERAAAADRATGIRRAQEQREKGLRVLSEQRAKGAKSGAGTAEGEGYLDIVGDTAERAQYYSELEIAGGEDRARGREGQAAVARWQGEEAESAGYVKAGQYGFQAADEIFGKLDKRARQPRGRYYGFDD